MEFEEETEIQLAAFERLKNDVSPDSLDCGKRMTILRCAAMIDTGD